MKALIMLIFLLAVFPLTALANTSAKVAKLMKAQGLHEIWQQQKEMGIIDSKRQTDIMLKQFMSQLSPSKEYSDHFSEAKSKFMKKLQTNWTIKDISDLWAEYYAPKFTDAELDQLLTFYESDVGQKEVQAGKVTIIEFTKHFQEENAAMMKKAIKDYVAKLQLIAKVCNCKKEKRVVTRGSPE